MNEMQAVWEQGRSSETVHSLRVIADGGSGGYEVLESEGTMMRDGAAVEQYGGWSDWVSELFAMAGTLGIASAMLRSSAPASAIGLARQAWRLAIDARAEQRRAAIGFLQDTIGHVSRSSLSEQSQQDALAVLNQALEQLFEEVD